MKSPAENCFAIRRLPCLSKFPLGARELLLRARWKSLTVFSRRLTWKFSPLLFRSPAGCLPCTLFCACPVAHGQTPNFCKNCFPCRPSFGWRWSRRVCYRSAKLKVKSAKLGKKKRNEKCHIIYGRKLCGTFERDKKTGRKSFR